VFNRLRDEGGLSRAWQLIGEVHWIRCRCAEMERVLERALKHAERAGKRRARSRILSDLASATVVGPRPVEDGIRRCNAILARADDDVRLAAVTETMLAVLEAMEGRFDEARDRWQRSKRRLEDIGLTATVAVLKMYCGFIELFAGSPENAQPEISQAYAVLKQIGERDRLATTAAVLARVLYALGRYDESEHYCQISEEAASKDDVGSQVIWRGTRSKVLARAGETRLAEELANSGVALASETDFLMQHADALSDRAEVLSILNRPSQAANDLEAAIALYERKGIRVSALAALRAYKSLASGSAASAGSSASQA
jgi:tetratricopeptide (TPR) repeat protein